MRVTGEHEVDVLMALVVDDVGVVSLAGLHLAHDREDLGRAREFLDVHAAIVARRGGDRKRPARAISTVSWLLGQLVR